MMQQLIVEQQSVSFIILLLLSFVLPVSASRRLSESAVQLAWGGQFLIAIAGLAMLVLPQFSFVALAIAMACCGAFTYIILQLPAQKVAAESAL